MQLAPDVPEIDLSLPIGTYSGVGAWTYDFGTGKTWWSEGVYGIYGLEPPMDFAPELDQFFTPEDAERILKAIERARTFGESWDIEAPFQSADDRKLWVRSTGSPVRRGDGTIVILGGFFDLTVHHQLRQDANENHNFVESILDNLPHMVFVKDARDLRFVKFNKAGEKLLGVDSSQLIGKSDYDFFPAAQADHFVAKDRHTLAQRVTIDIPEEPIQTPNGVRYLHTRKVTVLDDSGEPAFLLGISEDITERKEQAKLIENQRAALEHSSRLSSLGEMAGGVAHEINNPLAIISGVGERLANLVDEAETSTVGIDGSQLRHLSEILTRTVQRVARIVSGLRDFSRDGTKDPIEAVPVIQLIDETLGLCAERFHAHGVELVVDPIATELVTDCQPVRVAQVLINLLNNAFDAVFSQKSIKREIRIHAQHSADGKFVEIYVCDSGPGVDPMIADRIMLPFFTTKPLGKGTGLGLSISRGICEAQGGALHFVRDSAKLPGACFVVQLPVSGRDHQAA